MCRRRGPSERPQTATAAGPARRRPVARRPSWRRRPRARRRRRRRRQGLHRRAIAAVVGNLARRPPPNWTTRREQPPAGRRRCGASGSPATGPHLRRRAGAGCHRRRPAGGCSAAPRAPRSSRAEVPPLEDAAARRLALLPACSKSGNRIRADSQAGPGRARAWVCLQRTGQETAGTGCRHSSVCACLPCATPCDNVSVQLGLNIPRAGSQKQ